MPTLSSSNILIGIAGPSCSGKSSLEANLQSELGDEAVTFPFDDLFIGADALNDSCADREGPDVYRWDDYFNHLITLKNGAEITLVANSKESVQAGIEYRLIRPKPVIVAAGFLALHSAKVNKLFDASIYLDLPEDEIIRRRLARALPNDPLDSLDYIRRAVLPGNQKYVLPQRSFAEYVLDATSNQATLTHTVIEIIQKTISKRVHVGSIE